MAARFLSDLAGTFLAYFRIGKTGPRLKASGANLLVRNSGDTADAEVTAAKVNVSGDAVTINSDAAASGADWAYTIQRPATGMGAAVALTLPVDDGSAGQVLQTDGNGVLSWVSAAATAHLVAVDVTNLAHNSTSTVAMFTLPANAVIHAVRVTVDTAFNGTGPSMSVGVSGTASKYMGAGDVDLATAGVYEVAPGIAPSGSTEALQIAFTAATGSPSAGAARVEVFYSVPQ